MIKKRVNRKKRVGKNKLKMKNQLERIVNKEVETTIILADIHYPLHNKKALNCAEQILKYIKPDRIVYLGDAMDMTPVSHWLQDKRKSMENKRLLKDYEGFNEILDRHKQIAGSNLKEVVYLEGNHENWITQYIDTHPETEGLLEVEKNLKLKERGIKFLEMNKFYKLGSLFLTHGLYTNLYHSKKTVETVGRSIMYGHTHDCQIYTKIGLLNNQDKHQGISVPCLCDLSPEYMKGKPNKWLHGLSVIYTQRDGNFNAYIINIIDGRAVFNGKVFKG